MSETRRNVDEVGESRDIKYDFAYLFDYRRLVEEEIDEYCNIEVTEDLTEGGIHAQDAWGYWFNYLSSKEWQSSLIKEISIACENAHEPQILSLGCGYGGHEFRVASAIAGPYRITALDLNHRLFDRAIKRAKENNFDIDFRAIDLNYLKLQEGSFDVIYAHASIHHLLNLENLFEQTYRGLKSQGRFIVQDIIGKTRNLFWKANVDFARAVIQSMPMKYNPEKIHIDSIVPPYVEGGKQIGMEGIRQEDIISQAGYFFEVEKMYQFGSFMRMICTNPIVGKNIDPDVDEDRQYLDQLCELDLQQIREGKLRATEMLAVYKKKPENDIDWDAIEESARQFLARFD